MDEPITIDQVLVLIHTEHERLMRLLKGLTEIQMTTPVFESGWSIKDILAHLTAWEQNTLRMIESAVQGQPPASVRRPDEDWQTAIDRVNAQTFATNRDRPLASVLVDFQRSFEQLVEVIGVLSNDDLQDTSAISQVLGSSVRQLIAGDTYEHYQEHAALIRAWLHRDGVVATR